MGRRALVGWVALVRRLAWLVLIATLLSSAALLLYTTKTIGITADTKDLLSEELDHLRYDVDMDAAFPGNVRNLSVVVEGPSPEAAEQAAESLAAKLATHRDRFTSVFFAPADPYFRRNGLLYLERESLESMSDRLAEAQPILALLAEDPSLRGLATVLEMAVEQADAEIAGGLARVLQRLAETVERVADGEPALFSWRSALDDAPPGDSERRAFIQLKPVLEFDSLAPVAPAQRVIAREAEALGLSAERGYRIRVLGASVLLQDELRSVREGIGFVGLLSFVLVLTLLSFGLGSWRLVLAALVTLIAGLVWTGAFAAAAIGSLNLISVAFAVLFIGLSVDFGIHYCLRYREARAEGEEHGEALAAAAAGVGPALTLSAITAAIGFLSFLPTAYRGVSELGLISGAGMIIALFANLTVLPAMLTLLPGGKTKPRRGGTAFAAPLQGFIERRARHILIGAGALALAGLVALPLAHFDDDPFNLRDPDSPSMQDLLALIDDPRVQPYDAELLLPSLSDATAMAARLEALPEVKAARSLLDFVPDEQDDKLAIVDDMNLFLGPLFFGGVEAAPPDAAERLAAVERIESLAGAAEDDLAAPGEALATALARLERGAASLERLEQALMSGFPRLIDQLGDSLGAGPVALEDLPAPLARRYLAEDGQARLQIIPSEDLRDRAARHRFVDAVLAVTPKVIGTPVSVTAGGRAVRQAFQEAGLYAFGAILLLLLLLLRSLRETALILAPLLLAALLTGAATVLLSQPFNFANVIVLPLLLGLGVAFGIQIVLRARLEGSARLLETSTPRAVAFSALTTIGSFCSLSLSSHPGTASMGFLLTVAISLTLLCTLLVLPALLSLAGPGRLERKGSHPLPDPPPSRGRED